MKNKILGHIFALLTITIWSSTFIVSKIVLESLTPMQVLLFRFLLAALLLTIIYPKFTPIKDKKNEAILVLSAFCLFGYYMSENTALVYTYATNVSLIVATIPIISLFLTGFITKEKTWTKNVIIGFAIAYIGVMIIIINGNTKADIKIIGDLIALAAAIFFAVYSYVLSKANSSYPIVRLTRNVFYYMIIMLVVLNLFNGITNQETLSFSTFLSPNLIGSLLYLGIAASCLAFIMWNQAIRWIGGIRTNQYIYFVPVITTIMAAIWLNEVITVKTFIGAVLIIGGVYVSEHQYPPRKEVSEA